MPAFARTPSGMASFLRLDTDMETAGAGPSTGPSVAERLERYIDPRSPDEEWQYDEVVNGDVGEKRKMCVSCPSISCGYLHSMQDEWRF